MFPVDGVQRNIFSSSDLDLKTTHTEVPSLAFRHIFSFQVWAAAQAEEESYAQGLSNCAFADNSVGVFFPAPEKKTEYSEAVA